MQAHRLAPVLVLLALTALLGESVPAASARVAAATAIAGPDSAIVELGGVAMAADGTGGLVYRRFEAGATHVFAARYDGSRWHPPQRVDAGQRFESAWPRIGAANNGQLVVTWTQDGPPGQDSLYSAVLPRGGQTFLPPTLIDWTVGEASATYPSLAMAPGGAALLAYRVVTFDGLSRFTMPGYVRSEVRLARFNGSRWSKLGQPVNRNRLTPQREPTAANSPKVAITPDGNGVVAWQEPDDQLVDRVWARRIFGMRTGIPLQASPVTASGTAIGGNADALAIDETEFGRTIVALRQAPDQRERASGPRIFINELPQETDKEAKAFAHGPQLADVTTIGGDAPRGAPLVALGETDSLLLAFPRGDATVLASGEADRVEQFQVTGGITGIEPALDAGIDGRGTIAFASGEGGGRVIVQQLDGAKPIGTQAVSGPAGGPVRSIAVAGSGTGDALVAFAQGDPEEGQIAVARVEAAPVPFLIETPDSWTRAWRPLVTWEAPADGFRPRSYTIQVDGRNVARASGFSRRFRFAEGTLADGSHTVRVIATSGGGDSIRSRGRPLRIDRRPPSVLVRAVGGKAAVEIDDGKRRKVSGVGRNRISWGDGSRGRVGRSGVGRHEYAHPGTYLVMVEARDRAGNAAVVRQRVAVR